MDLLGNMEREKDELLHIMDTCDTVYGRLQYCI